MSEIAKFEGTVDWARRITDEINTDLSSLRDKVCEAYMGEADRLLGYESWDAYREAEIHKIGGLALPKEDRKAEVARLGGLGYPKRAIAAAVSASESQVYRDLEPPKREDEDQEDEAVDAELVDEEPEPEPPKKDRAKPTDVNNVMFTITNQMNTVASLSESIKLQHLKNKPESAESWLKSFEDSLDRLAPLIKNLRKVVSDYPPHP